MDGMVNFFFLLLEIQIVDFFFIMDLISLCCAVVFDMVNYFSFVMGNSNNASQDRA